MTDNLAEVKDGARVVSPADPPRRAPITLDVMWDHFLSQHWAQLSPDQPLDEFVRYAQRAGRRPSCPTRRPASSISIEYLWSERWLERYREMEFIQRVLNGMASRRPRLEALRDSWYDLDNHYGPSGARSSGAFIREMMAPGERENAVKPCAVSQNDYSESAH